MFISPGGLGWSDVYFTSLGGLGGLMFISPVLGGWVV